ncbi:lipoate--protein ligase family protein [Paenibacillaceae bacterium]|nr:lipoate--protein ligase family protein [Paenibacillaceae bacterium]
MKITEHLHKLQQLQLLDRSMECDSGDALYPFALDELLCRRAGIDGVPICHIWRHSGALILGTQDYRLPGAEEGTDWFESLGIQTAVRHSGGAAVLLDAGVVNISLIYPAAGNNHHTRYRDDFELMYQLIAAALQPAGVQVEKGIINGSYCPGDYDLSIGGRKFCGVAQRRQVKAFIIQAFVIVGGLGDPRARQVRQFYDLAAHSQPESSYPQVREGRMASLAELIPPAQFLGGTTFNRLEASDQTLDGIANAGQTSQTGETDATYSVQQFVRDIKATINLAHLNKSSRIAPQLAAMPDNDEIRQMASQLRQRYNQI